MSLFNHNNSALAICLLWQNETLTNQTFVCTNLLQDRLTVQEREREEAKERAKEHEAQRAAEARRRETLRIVESTVKAEVAERRNKDSDPLGENIEPFESVNLKFWMLPTCKQRSSGSNLRPKGSGPLKAAFSTTKAFKGPRQRSC